MAEVGAQGDPSAMPEAERESSGRVPGGDTSKQAPLIRVEVAFARPERQCVIELQVARGCTALEAARRSGIVEEFPEIDLETADMGIFARVLDGTVLPPPAEYVLREHDRVEIYRPLQMDPKEARLQRARRAKERRAGGR